MNPSTPQWSRYSRRERFARFIVFLGLGIVFAMSMRQVEVIPEFLIDAPQQVGDLLSRMWPIDFSFYREGIHAALMETLHIATLGTILTLFLALPIGVMAATNITRFGGLNWFAKLLLVSSRSVNTLVWALLFVAVFGPGALAGTICIAFRSVGFVGKLFAEALEESDPGPVEAMVAAGAPPGPVFFSKDIGRR
jgi:phosphonate transport system permease protein